MLRIRTTVNSEDIFLDLYRNEPVFLSLSFAELQDITKKNSNFSKAFSLPGSKKNNEVFNFFYDLNAIPTTFDPNNKFSATLMWDGYEIMVGYIRLNGVTIANGEIIYQVTFYNQVGDLMANIGDKFLFDLDLNYLSHPYSQNVILQSNLDPDLFPLTGNTNYSYQNGKTMWAIYNIGYDYVSANTINSGTTPLVQFTPVSNSGGTLNYTPTPGNFDYIGTPVHDYYFKPALQAKELYEAIVREAGYEVQSEFFETSYFKRFYMPLKFVDETIYSRNAIPPCYSYSNSGLTPDFYGVYTDPSSGVTCNSLGWTGTTTSLLIPFENSGQYTFRFTFTVTPTTPCDLFGTTPYINFIFNDTISSPISLYFNSFCEVKPQTVSFDQVFNLSGNSTLQFYFAGDYITVDSFQFEVIQGPRFIPNGSIINYDIEFPDNDYKQIDFITSTNKYFNLIVVPNPDEPNKLIIEPIIDYVGKGEVLDWTTKVDFSQPQNLYPTTALLNGTLEYEFKLDQDYANKDFQSQANRIFGTDKIKLGLEFKDSTTKFDYIFSSPIDITLNNAYVPIITMNSMSKLKQVDISGVTQQTFVPFKILPKLTFRGLTIPNDNWGFIGGSGTTASTNCTSGITYTTNSYGAGAPLYYTDCDGFQQVYYGSINGSNVLPNCADPYSLRWPLILYPYPSLSITSYGTPCNLPAASQYQYWYMDQIQQDRWTNINRFTTYPFNYTGFSHYINFRGEDQSNITPAEFSFVAKDLYDVYYRPYVEDLISEENKIYACKIYLYPQDIEKLRWNEKILINNTYFRINKITNFNALEPTICDIELVKLTKEYPGHPKLYYDLIPCSTGSTLHTNSDLMFNLYAYAGNYVKLYDTSLNYLGCYGVTVVDEDPNVDYRKYWLGTGYTSNLVGAYPDCACTGRTEYDVVQEQPGEDRLFWYSATDCTLTGTSYTFVSTNPDLLTGTTSYKIYHTGNTQTVCVYNPQPTFIQATPWRYLSAYTDCAECLFVPPSPTPTQTPTNTPTPSITPTISVTPSVTASPTPSGNPCTPCYSYDLFFEDFDNPRIRLAATYTDCAGIVRNTIVGNGVVRTVCAQEGTVYWQDGEPPMSYILQGASCGSTCPTPTPTGTPTPTPTRSGTVYTYAGGASTWSNSTTACTNKTCARPYYRNAPTFANGQIVYDNSSLTTPFNGGGNWVAIDTSTGSYCSGTGWRAIQIDNNGVILNSIACP